jgi:hypothetical protein
MDILEKEVRSLVTQLMNYGIPNVEVLMPAGLG